MKQLGAPDPTRHLPGLAEYRAMVKERPAVAKTLADHRAAMANFQ
jgi:hypothetical protein